MTQPAAPRAEPRTSTGLGRLRRPRGHAAAASERPSRRLAAPALGALCAVYLALAALPAAPSSEIVLGTAGGSPDWLLGPLRFAGLDGAADPAAGPLFYAGLWLALLLYTVVLLRSAEVGARVAVAVICALHALFLLAPPLLSQDVFSYIAYARLDVEHGLNPYAATPLDIFGDPVFGFSGSKDASSVYGPLFTLGTYPLVPLGVPAGLWILKSIMTAASLGVVWLVWLIARRLDRDPVLPALAVGLNPLVLVHVVGGGHNEALMMLATMAGVLALVTGRDRTAAVATTAAAGVKASAALVVPFVIAAARRPGGAVLAAAACAAAIAAIGLVAFGAEALDALSIIGSNQERTSSFSLPHKAAQLLALVFPGDALDYREALRAVFAVAFAATFVWLLVRTRRGADPIAMAGWATLALLLASAWLVPWYALWLLPLAALADDRRLLVMAVVLSAWMLPIAIPF